MLALTARFVDSDISSLKPIDVPIEIHLHLPLIPIAVPSNDCGYGVVVLRRVASQVVHQHAHADVQPARLLFRASLRGPFVVSLQSPLCFLRA